MWDVGQTWRRLATHSAASNPLSARRNELLNGTLLPSLQHARVALAFWRTGYDTERTHSCLSWQTPAEFGQTFTPQRGLMLRNLQSFGPAHVAQPTKTGSSHPAGSHPRWMKVGGNVSRQRLLCPISGKSS